MKVWVHIKSGKLYFPIDWEAMLQEDQVWKPAVIYCSLSSDTVTRFIRSVEEFKQKFKEVDM